MICRAGGAGLVVDGCVGVSAALYGCGECAIRRGIVSVGTCRWIVVRCFVPFVHAGQDVFGQTVTVGVGGVVAGILGCPQIDVVVHTVGGELVCGLIALTGIQPVHKPGRFIPRDTCGRLVDPIATIICHVIE